MPAQDPHASLEEMQAEVARLDVQLREHEARIRALEEAVHARDAFIAIAGHELRNPMGTVLMLATSLVHQVRKDARALEAMPSWLVPRLGMLEKHARVFVRRATTLLDVSRVNHGQVRLAREPIDLSTVVREGLEALVGEVERAGATLHADLVAEAAGDWDRTALEQVVHSLVSNAVKYGAGKPIDIGLVADETTATLTVRDRGLGISDDDRARIFERFERAVAERSNGGFGLGLWISRQLVRGLGGHLEVESLPGEGSLFTVVLPRSASVHLDPRPPRDVPSSTVGAGRAAQGRYE